MIGKPPKYCIPSNLYREERYDITHFPWIWPLNCNWQLVFWVSIPQFHYLIQWALNPQKQHIACIFSHYRKKRVIWTRDLTPEPWLAASVWGQHTPVPFFSWKWIQQALNPQNNILHAFLAILWGKIHLDLTTEPWPAASDWGQHDLVLLFNAWK